jgi:RNA polymerase sigma factor (sigma-70 family)
VNSTTARSVSQPAPALGASAEDVHHFVESIRPHEHELRSYLRGRFPALPDVDDLVQETYARLLRARLCGLASLTRAYLFVVARNVGIDLVRRNRVVSIEHLGTLQALSVVDDKPDAAETLSHDQELALLAEAIESLPPRCQEILRLRRIDGLSHRAIAEKMGIAEGTVNAQLAIGIIRCRQFLCARGVTRACVQPSVSFSSDVR